MSGICSRFKIILASILIACIVLNLFPLTLLALDEPYYSVSDEYEFSVTRVISSRWEDHANIDFTITNNGDTTIDNWFISTDLPYEVENIWNASIAEASDSYITISSAPQNQPIEPGCSVTFGITGYSEDDSLFDVESSFYLLNIEDVIIPVEKYQATTNVYSTTETGFSGAIAITNISSELLTIGNVVLNSTNGLTINGNAAIEDETTLVVDSSSRNIYPSASIYINFEGTEEIPEVIELRYTGLAFTLTEDENENGILDIDEFLYPEEPEVTPTPTITPTNTPEVEEPTETPTVTPEEEPTPSTTPDIEEPTETPTVAPTTTPDVEEPTPTPEIIGWASTTRLTNNNASEIVSFFLDTRLIPCSYVELWENGVFVSRLYDDGRYAYDSDDIGGDGIYSTNISINTTTPGDRTYTIVANFENGENVTYEIVISVVDTSERLFVFNTVMDTVQKYWGTDEYDNDDLQTRLSTVTDILLQLESDGFIEPGSVHVVDGRIVCCDTINGVGIDFECEESDPYHNSLGETNLSTEVSIDGIVNEDYNNSSNLNLQVLYIISFDEVQRYGAYDYERTVLEQNGVSITMDYFPNYSDYMTCLAEGYDIVVFSGHGVYDETLMESRISSGIIVERSDEESVDFFNEEASRGLVRFVPIEDDNDSYIISLTADFFREKYSNYPDNNTVVLFENCELFGVDGAVHYDFADALDSIGIPFSVGFVNSVHYTYSLRLYRYFIIFMNCGQTTSEALNNAIEIVGENDEVLFDTDGIEAYPLSCGDGSYRISMSTIDNASFEYHGSYGPPNINTIYGWECSGDVKPITNLSSDIVPTEGDYMAMISTGIGSGENVYFASGEGSSIEQTFTVSEDFTCLYFDVNMVSEEPMQWVGSQFDDCFEVRLIDSETGEEQIVYTNSINNANWISSVNVNFDGGDATAFQTGWETISVDLEVYSGSQVTLAFIIHDVGDSNYDTVALVDNIRCGG